ncbi:MFS transporter [Lactiplantibacillus paraplantarum]|nr:MFS transporter [Lactiplantibacillus paraplantarum]MCW1910527.1 MFS transporter [Lactiplantibacillus paraplantarum]OAX76828.1 MFS transporter [Lactiplantibacillus plantarum]RDG10304.1 MFS transporter [Lactiplantibacillus paraplantarum]
MKNLSHNRAFVTLTVADIFETIGTSLFNIILLTYARTFAQASLMVSLVSVATVLPGVLGIITGRLADTQSNKRGWLVGLKFIQAMLYMVLAQLITSKQVGLLLIIIAINLCSDVLGMMSSSLRMPLLQAKVTADLQEEALGINQGIGVLVQTLGQALGVSILAATGDYQLAGYLNAVTFLLAGVVLLCGYGALRLPSVPAATTPPFRQLLQQVRVAMEAGAHMNVLALLASVLLLNAVGASVDALLNLYLIDHGAALPLSFGGAALVMNTAFVIGSVAGNLLHTGWFQKWSFRAVMLTTVVTFEGLFINLLSWQNYWVVVTVMMIGGFCMGQANPKLMASLLKVADRQIVGSLSGIINSLATISIPIGSVGLVLLANVVGPQAAYLTAMGLLLACGGCLFIRR